MSPLDWWLDRAVDLAVLVLTFLIIPLVQWIRQMRNNELKHIAGGIERIREDIQGLVTRLERLGSRLDEHIHYHLERKL